MAGVKKNIVWQSLYQVLMIIVPLMVSPYVSRVLGPTHIGIYSYYNTIALYFGYFIMLGVANYGNKMIARVGDDKNEVSKTFWNIYGVQFISGIICLIVYVLTQCSGENSVIARIQILLLISSMFDINWLFYGKEKFKFTTIRSVIVKVAMVIAIFVFVKTKQDLWKYTLIMSITMVFNQLLLWIAAKDILCKPKLQLKLLLSNVKPLIIYFIPVISGTMYKYMAKLLLGIFSNMEQVGYYDNSEKLINIPLGFVTAISLVMLPKMSFLATQKNERLFQKYMNMSFMLSCILTSALMFGLLAVADDVSLFFWGKEFVACGVLIQILAISLPFTAWSSLLKAQYLLPLNKEKVFVCSLVTGAVISIILNLILIPSLASVGAAISTLVAEITVAVYQSFMIRKEMRFGQYFKDNIIFFVMGAIMFVCVYFVSKIELNLILKVAVEVLVGVVVYGIQILLYMKKNKRIKSILFDKEL